MERKLNYILSLDGVNPADKRFAGIQGEDRATAIIVTPDDALLSKVTNAGEDVFCSFDVLCENGELFRGEKKEIARISEPFYLTEAMTASGLDVIVIVKVMYGDSSIYKAQLKLYFEACPTYKTLTADKKDEVLSLQKAAQEIFASFEEKVQGAQNLLDAKALAAAGSAGLAAGHLDKVIRLSDNAKAFSESAEQSSEEAKASAMAAKQDFETVKGLFSAAIQNIDNHNSAPDSHGDIREQLDLAKGRIDSIKTDQTFNPTSENAQSGKAVAEAVANVSGGSAEKEWELIEDITLTEAVIQINIPKTKLQGIKELHISAYIIPADTSVTKQNIDFGVSGKSYWRAQVNCSQGRIYVVMDVSISPRKTIIFDGTASIYDYTLSGTGYKGLGYFRTADMNDEGFTDLSSGDIWMRTTAANLMATGTRFKVWGR